MYVTHVDKVREYELKSEGYHKVRVKYLLHAGIGVKRLQLRLFTIDVGGYTSKEKHAHEHEVFFLRGKALVKGENEEYEVGPGSVIFIRSWELHQIINIGDEPVQFICTKETSELPEPIKEDMEKHRISYP